MWFAKISCSGYLEMRWLMVFQTPSYYGARALPLLSNPIRTDMLWAGLFPSYPPPSKGPPTRSHSFATTDGSANNRCLIYRPRVPHYSDDATLAIEAIQLWWWRGAHPPSHAHRYRAEPAKSGALCETLKQSPMVLENFDYSIIIISEYLQPSKWNLQKYSHNQSSIKEMNRSTTQLNKFRNWDWRTPRLVPSRELVGKRRRKKQERCMQEERCRNCWRSTKDQSEEPRKTRRTTKMPRKEVASRRSR
jgi:hypothetical protein